MESLFKPFEDLRKNLREATCEQLKDFTRETIQYLIDHLDGMGVIDEESMKKIVVLFHNQIFYENVLIDMIREYRNQ